MIWWLVAILAFLVFVVLLPINLNIYFDGQFRLSVRVLFIKYTIPLGKDGKKKQKPKKQKKSKKTVSTDGDGFTKKLSGLINSVKTVKHLLLGSLTIHKFKAHITVSCDDPCDTALVFGTVNALIYSLHDFFASVMTVKNKDIVINADYNGEKTLVVFDVILRTTVFRFLRNLILMILNGKIKSKDN